MLLCCQISSKSMQEIELFPKVVLVTDSGADGGVTLCASPYFRKGGDFFNIFQTTDHNKTDT